MLSGMKLDSDIAKSSREMRDVFGHGRNSAPQQTAGSVRETIAFPCSGETFQFQHMNKLGHALGQPYYSPNHEFRPAAKTGQVAQSKSSECAQKTWIGHKCGDGDADELIKHMSNLPGFLQQVEKGKTIQEKALNFGVLDWKRLEKWKFNERMPGRSPKKTSPSSGPPKMVPSMKKQPYLHGRNPSSFYSGKQSFPHGSESNSFQQQPTPPHSPHLKDVRYVSYHKEKKFGSIPIKTNENETYHQRLQPAQVSTVCRQQDQFRQRVQLCQRSCSKTNMDNSKTKDPWKDISLPEQGQYKSSLLPVINALGKNGGMSSEDEIKISSECSLAGPRNRVPPPKHLPKNGHSGSSQFTKSRASLDGQLFGVAGNTLSGFFSADVPHSLPRHSDATFHSEHTKEPHNLAKSHATDLDIRTNTCPSANSATSTMSESKCLMIPEERTRPSTVVEASNKIHADIAEQPIARGRAPSPTRRFSFSLGKLSRSGSFKDGSAVPQLSSTHANIKSGQVKPEVSSGTDNHFERDKESAGSRHSSPLRRLLNPLLKFKGAQSSETARPSNGSIRTMAIRTTGTKGPSQDRKPEASCVHALLQLTLKNELPFFKLVVDNSEDMLAAAVKRLPSSGKSDPCMIYAFYSVHEIRKKGMNWISQGSKSKSCSLGYKIVGQMKISNSYHLKLKAGDDGACGSTECVLYGADPGQVDKQMLEFVPNKEIAAIIVRNLRSWRFKETKFPQPESVAACEMEESKISNGMVVILPGGVHSVPIKGAPSSLISRWRSGGQCDCGGWDVGCKLRVLADHKRSSSNLQASVSSSDINRVNLFIRGDDLKSKPVFSLEPLKNGLYSVELDASISLLEAFATCVAYVTCSKFPKIIDVNDAQHFPEAIRQTDATKTPITFQDNLPAKFITCPPLSPAGRI